jgi:topoisomerase-4 subunit A
LKRLSKFALEVIYSQNYRLVFLMMDEERDQTIFREVSVAFSTRSGGIAGLSTKVLPHNFNELIDSSIKILKGSLLHCIRFL